MKIEFEYVYKVDLKNRDERVYRDVFETEVREVASELAPVVARLSDRGEDREFDVRLYEGRFYRTFEAGYGDEGPFRTESLKDPKSREQLARRLHNDGCTVLNLDQAVKRRGKPDPAVVVESRREKSLELLRRIAGDPLSVDGILFMPIEKPHWAYHHDEGSYHGGYRRGYSLDWRSASTWRDAVGLDEPDVLARRLASNPHLGAHESGTAEVFAPDAFSLEINAEMQIGRAVKETLSGVARMMPRLPLETMLAYVDARDAFGHGDDSKKSLSSRLEKVDALLEILPYDGSRDYPAWQLEWLQIDRERLDLKPGPASGPDQEVYEGFSL